MKRITILLLLVVFIISISMSAGCKAGETTPAEKTTAVEKEAVEEEAVEEEAVEEEAVEEEAVEEISGTINISHIWNAGTEYEAIKATFDGFIKKYPNVEFVEIPNDAFAYKTWLPINLSSDEPVDVFMYWTGVSRDILNWINSGWAENIEDLWVKNDFANRMIDGLDATAQDPVTGDHYGVPADNARSGFFYNKKVFDANNIEEPETWEELQQVLITLKEVGAPWVLPGTTGAFINDFVFGDILNHVADDEYRVNMLLHKVGYFADDPRFREAAEFWQEYFEPYVLINEGIDIMAAIGMFVSGEAGMIYYGDFLDPYLESMLDAIPGEDHDMFKFPVINPELPEVSVTAMGGMMVAENARNMPAARAYMEYWMTEEAQLLFSYHKRTTTALAGGTDTSFYLMNKILKEFEGNGITPVNNAISDIAVSTEAIDLVTEFFLGNTTVDEFTTAYNDLMNKVSWLR